MTVWVVLEALFIIIWLILVWCLSCAIAWAVNHNELKRTYGSAPFNWRVFGYMAAYIPWLKRINDSH